MSQVEMAHQLSQKLSMVGSEKRSPASMSRACLLMVLLSKATPWSLGNHQASQQVPIGIDSVMDKMSTGYHSTTRLRLH